MSKRITRRTLLRNTTLAGVGLWLSGGNSSSRAQSANEKLDIAVVGVAGRGGSNLNGVGHENIVALCDVDQTRLGKAAERFPQAKTFRDFRKMLDEIHPQVDAVVVSTPDHVHAPAASLALGLGKHVYCEKPLTHSVYETRRLTELARKNKLATQLGTQIHAGANYRRVVELVQSGAIGPVEEVHVWQPGNLGGLDRPTDTPPVPENLDWDLWLGPAPYRPYHPAYVPARWRAWWDFGNGTLGDFGCHYMDLPFWALKLKYPETIEAQGPPVHPETTAQQLEVRYRFGARGDLPPVTMTWYNGGLRPKGFEGAALPDWRSAVLFVGSEGMLQADYGKRVLLPESKFADFQAPEPTIPDSVGHHQEWINACKTGSPTTCNFDYSGPLTETVLLGNVAYRAESKLCWDAKTLKATNCSAADRFLRRAYREGWTLS